MCHNKASAGVALLVHKRIEQGAKEEFSFSVYTEDITHFCALCTAE